MYGYKRSRADETYMRKPIPAGKRTVAAAVSTQLFQSSVQLKSVGGDLNVLHDKLVERSSRAGAVQLKACRTSVVNEQVGIVQRVETEPAVLSNSKTLRRNAVITNRHAIPRPLPPEPGNLVDDNGMENLASWAATLMRTRIPDLFRTSAGLPGHVQQVQQELARLNNIINNFDRPEGDERGPRYIELAMQFAQQIRGVLIKFADQACQSNEFPFRIYFEFPCYKVLSLENKGNGHLLVNGKQHFKH